MAELSESEVQHLTDIFKQLKVKPKCDTVEDFKRWMSDFVKQMQSDGSGTVKQEVQPENAQTTSASSASHASSHYIPKLSCFSGDGSKQDTTYDLWRYEVECLIHEKYKEEIIAQSIRRSLRGDAGKVAMRLGPEATITQILEKMESVFGTAERGEKIIQEFYSASQGKGEDSMSWSCRLEEIYRKAVIKGAAKREEANDKLRTRYWNGLHQWIRDITGYKFDQLTDFDALRKEIRLVEKEHDSKKAQSNMAVTSSDSDKGDEMKELKGMIQQLTSKVEKLESNQGRNKPEQHGRGNNAHRGDNTRQSSNRSRGRGSYQPQYNNNRGYGRGTYYPQPMIMAMHMDIKRVMRQRMDNLYATDATNQATWLENVQLSWTIAVGV